MLQIGELHNRARSIRTVANPSMDTRDSSLVGLLHRIDQPLNRSAVPHSRRLYGNLQVFVRMPSSGTLLNTTPTCVSSHKIFHLHTSISDVAVGGSETAKIFLLIGVIYTSDGVLSLFMDVLYACLPTQEPHFSQGNKSN